MVVRQQNSIPWRIRLLTYFLVAGLACWAGSAPAQDSASSPRHPASAALEGAPPDPDAFLIAPHVAEALERDYPRSIQDLQVIETQLRKVLRKVVPATVGIQIGPSAGSGVIISPDGLVLTAGHVSGEPGRDAVLIMPDGRRVKGKTLGLNRRIDSGLMQITEPGPWPYVEMAGSNEIDAGEWVIATGHPGGFNRERTPPVRLGRVLYASSDVICTDCTLVGGDSGGPLFNMKAQVIGIHSRIGRSVTSNFHVPIATYHDTWDRLAAGEMWGGRLPSDERGHVRPYLGIHLYGLGDGVLVRQVSPGTPAARAGLQENDVIIKFGGVDVTSREALIEELWTKQPGQRIELEVQRGDQMVRLRLVVGGIGRPLPGAPEYEPREPRSGRRGRRERGRERREQEGREQERREQEQPEPQDRDEAIPENEEPEEQHGPEDESQPPTTPDDQKEPASGPAEGSKPKTQSSAEEAPHSDPAEKPAGQRDEPRPVDSLHTWGIELDPIAVRPVVARVIAGSKSELAGLRAGDVILRLSGAPTGSGGAVQTALAELGDGEHDFEMTVLRQGRAVTLSFRNKEGQGR